MGLVTIGYQNLLILHLKKEARGELKTFAIGAINEAFAVCSTAWYNEKTTGKPVTNDNEWYHGWQEANDLAKQMYPHFKEYLNEGRSFDCHFFTKLSISIKIDELKNANKLSPQKPALTF